VGEFATTAQRYLRAGLDERCPSVTWQTEASVGGTRVDIAGDDGGERYLVELEWRRADPADNAAKLFRHLAEGRIDADRVTVVHLFTRYYDLVSGGVSAKRANAEFVGSVAAETLDALTYHPLTFDLDPPKRGADRPSEWRSAADAAVEETVRRVDAR
jgi:hypothetical protein